MSELLSTFGERSISSVSCRPAVCHHDQDTRDRCVQRGLLPVAVPSGQEVNGPGDQPGDPDQEGGKREVSYSVSHCSPHQGKLTAEQHSTSAALMGVPVLPTGWEKKLPWVKGLWVSVLMFCQFRPRTLTTAQTVVWSLGCISSFCLCHARVYHIDSNMSGAGDSGPDVAKAIAVSPTAVSGSFRVQSLMFWTNVFLNSAKLTVPPHCFSLVETDFFFLNTCSPRYNFSYFS